MSNNFHSTHLIDRHVINSFVTQVQRKIRKNLAEQECIPVECVPSAAVAFGGGGCMPRGVVCPGGCLPRGSVCPGGDVWPGRSDWKCLTGGFVWPRGVWLGGLPQCMLGYTPHGQNSWHTLVKALPFHKYVTDSNKNKSTKTSNSKSSCLLQYGNAFRH